jgi:hypothetical protein
MQLFKYNPHSKGEKVLKMPFKGFESPFSFPVRYFASQLETKKN